MRSGGDGDAAGSHGANCRVQMKRSVTRHLCAKQRGTNRQAENTQPPCISPALNCLVFEQLLTKKYHICVEKGTKSDLIFVAFGRFLYIEELFRSGFCQDCGGSSPN